MIVHCVIYILVVAFLLLRALLSLQTGGESSRCRATFGAQDSDQDLYYPAVQ